MRFSQFPTVWLIVVVPLPGRFRTEDAPAGSDQQARDCFLFADQLDRTSTEAVFNNDSRFTMNFCRSACP
jgi:hypothetical protein